MTEPTGLNFIVIPASAETNYPVGSNPWNGTPIIVTPASDYDTPDTKPPAQTFNYRNNLLGKQDRRILNVAVTAAVSNFDNVVADTTISGSATAMVANFWHPYSQKWWTLLKTSSGFLTFSTHDAGRTWTAGLTETAAPIAGAAVPLSVGQAWYVIASSGGGQTFSYNELGGTISILTVAAITLPAALFPMQLVGSSNGGGWGFVGVTLSGSTYTGYYSSTTDSHANGGAFSNGSSGLPAAWQTGTCDLYGLASATNPTQTTLVAMCGVTPGTDKGRLLVVSPTGSFTDSQPSFMSTTVVTGVAYSANDALWGVLCNDGSNSYLYTCSDAAPSSGSTWTLVKTFVGMPLAGGLAVAGYVWGAQVGTASGSGDNRVMYSCDVGVDGASSQWATANSFLTGGYTPSSTPGSLASSGNGFAGWNSAKVHFSRQAGTMANGQI